MLNNYKYFKYARKLGFNLHNSPKLAFYASQLHEEKQRWEVFAKPFRSTTNLFSVSKYYSSKLAQNKKNLFVFFKRKKKQAKKPQHFFCLDTCLFISRFFKTLRQARAAVYAGFVCVNGALVKKSDYRVTEGSLISIAFPLLKRLLPVWQQSFFFSFFKTIKVFSQVSGSFEISYSTGSFCVCYSAFLK
jgi:ribosomal protein S4